MTIASVAPTHGASIKALVPDGWYTVSDAAAQVGKSADTLTLWRKGSKKQEPVFIPSGHMMVGELKVYLYSESDIEELKQIAKTRRPGRKPLA